MERIVATESSRMTEIKGPAIAPEAFRVEGHCCGIRIPALMEPGGTGVQFEVSPEIRAELLKAGIRAAEGPQDPPADRKPDEPAG
jgi:hypothetical protein